MQKRHMYHAYQLPQKSRRFETRDKIQILLLFVILIVWLFIRSSNKDVGQTLTSEPPTMQQLLEIAIQPMGSTMYIWGGGWDVGDKKSGAGSTRIGVSPTWEEFAKKQDASYDYEDYRYERELGLDCSGYVGWVMYNLFETEDGQEGYVTFSTEMAENFANRGWGKLYKNPKQFLTGDIVSMDGHVWICLGTCEDGSVLLIHSSPPGVSICGTEIPVNQFANLETENQSIGNRNAENQSTENQDMPLEQSEISSENQNEVSSEAEISIAIQLAEEFMETYYQEWQKKYPDRMVSQAYLEDVTVMRWNEETLADAQVYQGMAGEEVLQILGEFKKGK